MTLLLVFQELMRHRKLTVVAQRLGPAGGLCETRCLPHASPNPGLPAATVIKAPLVLLCIDGHLFELRERGKYAIYGGMFSGSAALRL
jgi:hypothetical protein